MSRTSWFQNTDWNAPIEDYFREKLRRVRDKSQPLRIQAFCLRRTHADVSLRLLEEYFSLSDRHHQDAAAYAHRAEAFLTLGRMPEAIDAYLNAIKAERERGELQTEARRDFAFLIASRKLAQYYAQALFFLGNGSDLLFPVQQFIHHSSIALISADLGDRASASKHATLALRASAAKTSGLRYHSGLGLLGDEFELTRKTLAELAAAPI
jgi:tetratricopeptide (TPR) repeat protein